MIQTLCQQLPSGAIIAGLATYSAFEWFMGKTGFGSTIGLLIEAPALKALAWIKAKISAV